MAIAVEDIRSATSGGTAAPTLFDPGIRTVDIDALDEIYLKDMPVVRECDLRPLAALQQSPTADRAGATDPTDAAVFLYFHIWDNFAYYY